MTHAILFNLTQATIGRDCVVEKISVPKDASDWLPWLEEIGFIEGERVQVKRRSILSQGAVVVRVGQSTFALHPAEAACVWVRSADERSENKQSPTTTDSKGTA